jgi:molybdopterin-guanine dinucleotide biosynthesis protein A
VTIGRESSSDIYRKFLPASVRIVKDRMRVKSPLVGILNGFRAMRCNYSAVLSCDTPFARGEVLNLLFKKATKFDAAIPRWPNGDIEPLQSVYRIRPAIPAAKLALTRQEYRSVDMIKRLRRVTYVPAREIKQVDKDLISFFNVNNRSDLGRAEAIQASSRA